MSVAKSLRAKRASLITDARALINKSEVSAEENTKFDAMMTEADGLMAQIERIERADAVAADLDEERRVVADITGRTVDQQADGAAREKRLLVAWMTGNVGGLSDADRSTIAKRASADSRFQNAGSVGTNTAGGYTVAPDFMRELLVAQKAYGGMRGAARVVSTDTGVDLPWPTMDDTANVATIVAENTAGAAGTDLVFGSKTLKAWTYRSGYLPISIELMQDSAFDFDTLVRDALALRFARGQNAHFTTGNGTTQPEGIATGGVVGKTGAAGQTTTVGFDDLVDLEHSVDPAYRPGSRFMFHDSTLKAIKKLKDSQQRPLFIAGYTVGAPDTLLGYPITINQDVATMAANAKSVFFGNFQNYVIRDVLGLRITRLNERFAENGQVAFIAFQRTDGRLASAAQPIKWYANSAT